MRLPVPGLWRSVRRQPLSSACSILVLALGLGFAIAAFSIAHTLLLRPYRYPRLGDLVIVRNGHLASGAHQGNPIAIPDFLDLARERHPFEAMAAFRSVGIVLSVGSSDPVALEGATVSASFFDVLGVRAVLGRTFAPDEGDPGHADRAVLSRRVWHARLGGDTGLIGRTVQLNGRATTIIGVIADEDCYPPGLDVWVPFVFTASERQERSAQHILAVARLAPGFTVLTARGSVAATAARLASQYPATNRDRSFDLLPLRREQYEFTATFFLFVQAAALGVLVLAVTNVATLLLSGSAERRRETAMRLALGASRRDVVAGALVDSAALGVPACLLALAFAHALMPLIHAGLPEGISRWIAGWSSVAVDGQVATAALLLSFICVLALGSFVGWHAAGSSAVDLLRDGGRASTGRMTLARRALVVLQVMFAAALLLGAAATLSGFRQQSRAFDSIGPETLLTFRLALPEVPYRDAAGIVEFQNRFLSGIRTLPGVAAAGMIRNEPASNVPSPLTPFVVDGRPLVSAGEPMRADLQVVSPDVLPLLHVTVRSGRGLLASDDHGRPLVAVVSRSLADRFWPRSNPVGARIRIDAASTWTTVVGVVEDLKINWYDRAPRPTIFVPHAQSAARSMAVLVRTAGDPLAAARPIRAVARSLDPLQPLREIRPMSSVVDESISPVRVVGLLLLAGGCLAVLLAATGIYGVLGQWVSARTWEFGIRIALGAAPRDVGALVVRETCAMAAAGIALALPAELLAISALRTELLGVAIADLPTAILVAAGVLAMSLAATIRPALRARRIEPAELLRS